MGVLATIFFTLAALGGAAVLAGVLWMVFAQSLWGHPTGPPLDASPEDVQAWHSARGHPDADTYLVNWQQVKSLVAAGRWRDVWPILFVVGGIVAVLLFLPLGILMGTDEQWVGMGGLLVGLFLIWRGYMTLTRGQKE